MSQSRPILMLTILIGIATGFTAALMVDEDAVSDGSGTRDSGGAVFPGPAIDLMKDGPLPSGERVSLEDAKKQTSYSLPVPPTDSKTGERTAIWIDPSHQVAFVYKTELVVYVHLTDSKEEDKAAQWTQKAAADTEPYWVITTVRGHTAIAADRGPESMEVDPSGIRPSTLLWIEQGVSIEFVSPNHSLDELESLAEQIKFEE
jgi:hypothetical protein